MILKCTTKSQELNKLLRTRGRGFGFVVIAARQEPA